MSAGKFGELAVGGPEGIVDRRHEHAALQAQHGVRRAVARCAAVHAAAGAALGKICGAQQARLVRDEIDDFLAVPDVIAAGENGDAGAEQLLGEARRDAEAGGGVLAIGDDQVQLLVGDHVGQALGDDPAAGRTDNVSDEKNPHDRMYTESRKRPK